MKYLIISDIHANLPALEAVLEKESDCDAIYFLGDAVDYGPFPQETLELLRSLQCRAMLLGNHDKMMLEAQRDADLWTRWTKRQLSGDNLDFIRSFSEKQVTEEWNGKNVLLHHGDFLTTGMNYIYRNSSNQHFDKTAERNPGDVIIFGHNHHQFIKAYNGTYFISPGSVGQQRCGNPLARYMIFDGESFRPGKVSYDIGKITNKIRKLPFPQRYINIWINNFENGVENNDFDNVESKQLCLLT